MLDYLFPLIEAIEHHVTCGDAPGVYYSSKRVADEINRFQTEDFLPETRTDLVFARTELTRWSTRIVGVPFQENWPAVKQALIRACKGHIGEKTSVEEQVGRRVLSVFISPLAQMLPTTMKSLHAAAVLLGQKGDPGGWNNVANSCRDALVIFTHELHTLMAGTLPSDIKQGDVKNTIRIVLKNQGEDERYRSTLSDMVDGLWNHVGSLVHKTKATRDDAERCYICTVIAITEVLSSIRKT